MNKEIFPSLTGIRAIAAYMVFIHHYNTFANQGLHDFFGEFHIGVTLFFVLSGFLIAHRYYDKEVFDFKNYILKRIARIYPMYFLLTTATFAFFAFFHAQNQMEDVKVYLMNITFLRGFLDDLKFSGIAQGWSLTVEELFYLSAPLFFILIKKSKSFLIIVPILFIGLGLLLVQLCSSVSFYGLMHTIDFMLDFTFFGRITEFFIGIGLALYLQKDTKSSPQPWFTSLGLLFIILSVYGLSLLKIGNGNGTDCILGKIINTLVLPLLGIAPLYYGLMKENTWVSRFLSSSLMVLLGKSSYIFYLIHMGIVVMLMHKFTLNIGILFVCLNVIAIGLYLFLEKPINQWILKKTLREN